MQEGLEEVVCLAQGFDVGRAKLPMALYKSQKSLLFRGRRQRNWELRQCSGVHKAVGVLLAGFELGYTRAKPGH